MPSSQPVANPESLPVGDPLLDAGSARYPQPDAAASHPERGLVSPLDARASLEARRELGPEMEQALVDSFVARVEEAIAQRDRAQGGDRRQRSEAAQMDNRNQVALGIVSLIIAIPLTAIGAGTAGIAGLLIAWVAIVLVNLAHALKRGRT